MPKGSRGGVLNSSTRKRAPRPTTQIGINMRLIETSSFKKTAKDMWDLSVSRDVGGANILDETGSSKALRMGLMPTQKLYSMIYWDKDGNMSKRQYFPTLNDAKYYAKEGLKGIVMGS